MYCLTCLSNLNIFLFLLSFEDFIILIFLSLFVLVTNDISNGVGRISELINDVEPLSETIHSRNSFLFLIVADKHKNLISWCA